jgi:hypothetical protein
MWRPIADRGQRPARIPRLQRPADPGQARPEAEDLGPPTAQHHGMSELDKRTGVRRHRTRHIEQQHQGTASRSTGGPLPLEGLAFRSQRPSKGSPEVEPRTSGGRPEPPGRAKRHRQDQAADQGEGSAPVLFGHVAEILAPQAFHVAGNDADGCFLVPLLVIRAHGRPAIGDGHAKSQVRVGRRPRLGRGMDERQLWMLDRSGPEVAVECMIEPFEVVMSRDQRRSGGQMQVLALEGIEDRGRPAEREDAPRPDRQAAGSQIPTEPDEAIQGGRRGLRHDCLSPRR